MTNKKEIFIRGGFSERKKIKKFSDVVQVTSLDERTRNKLYSIVQDIFLKMLEDYDNTNEVFVEYIYEELFSLTKNHIPNSISYNISYKYDYDKVLKEIYTIFLTYDYNEVFDFIEGLTKAFNKADQIKTYFFHYENEFVSRVNHVFITENVNYRIVNNIITDLVNEEEIKIIDETLNHKEKVISSHITKALEHLYKTKDYDNSIKESISAVEGMCQILTNKDNATLGDCLKQLKEKIHPALKGAFDKLYGYTSDANGIRHANGLGEGDSTFEEAKYMLISCSAFIDYLNATIK